MANLSMKIVLNSGIEIFYFVSAVALLSLLYFIKYFKSYQIRDLKKHIANIDKKINDAEFFVKSGLDGDINFIADDDFGVGSPKINNIKDLRNFSIVSKSAPVIIYGAEIKNGEIGRIKFVSAAAEDMLGYNREEITGEGWKAGVIHPDDLERVNIEMYDLYNSQTISADYRIRHKDGSYIWICDTISFDAERFDSGLQAVGSIIDITAVKLAEIRLIQAEKMASLGRMASGITHELSQPLNFIKLAAHNLQMREKRGQLQPEVLSEKIGTILAQVDRASNIIRQMGVFARMPSDVSKEMSLFSLLDAVSAMVLPQLVIDKVALSITRCERDLIIYGPPTILEQVFINLILNARDSISQRRISENLSSGLIKISIEPDLHHVQINVDDNGSGIPVAAIKHLFEPFFTTKPPGQGTGLGLSIAYGIITDLGGMLRAENIVNGARFTVKLPLVDYPSSPNKA